MPLAERHVNAAKRLDAELATPMRFIAAARE
jgi:hypothetical protein